MASPVNGDAASDPGESYALSGKIMLSGIVILFAVVVFLAVLHLYARWHLVRLRRLQMERRRRRRENPSHVVLYADGALPVDRGLEVAVLKSLPVSLYTPMAEQPECAVCLSEFEEKEIVRLLPKCNHSFHIDCIDMWFRSHSTCPLCRSPVEKAETAEELSLSGPGSSSVSSLCDACQHGDGGVASTKGEVRIEVPPRRAESGLELNLNSPASRLMYFKRILSMGRRSPSVASSSGAGCPTTPCGAGTSGGASELDLESGTGVSSRETAS